MNRQQLLNRLLAMQAAGEDMTAPIVVRNIKRVTDKRTRSGKRTVETFSDLQSAMGGLCGFSDRQGSTQYAELFATEWSNS